MMTGPCHVDQGGQTPPTFPLELPAELWRGRGGGFPPSVWLCPLVVTSLLEGGWGLCLSGAVTVPTSVHPFSFRVTRSSSGYLAGKEKRGSLPGGPAFLWLLGFHPKIHGHTHAQTHCPPSHQVPAKF